jgi:hypothetical protein
VGIIIIIAAKPGAGQYFIDALATLTAELFFFYFIGGGQAFVTAMIAAGFDVGYNFRHFSFIFLPKNEGYVFPPE